MMKKYIITIFLILAINFTLSAQVQSRVDLMIRVLKFDKSLVSRASGNIKIAIVYNNNKKESAQEAIKISGILNKAKGQKVKGKRIKNSLNLVSSSLKKELKDATVVYLTQGLDEDDVLKWTKKYKILSMAGSKDYIGDVSVVVTETGNKKIHITSDRLKEEGINLAAELLSIAQIH